MRKEEFNNAIANIHTSLILSKEKIGAQDIEIDWSPKKMMDASSRFDRGEPISAVELIDEQSKWISKDPLIDGKGNPFVLYINDHVISHFGEPSRVFHVSWCHVLQKMERWGRQEKYVKKADLGNNNFNVDYGAGRTGIKRLPACIPCREKMGNKVAPNELYYDRENLDITKFFQMYGKQDLKNMNNPMYPVDYPKNWDQISKRKREDAAWVCSKCNENFSLNRGNLDVHHKDGQRGNTSSSNLVVLCKKCHSEQFAHGHYKRVANSYSGINNTAEKREEVFFDPTSKSQINKFDAFLREPEKYATGTWRSAEKIKELKEYFESAKNQLTKEKQKEFRHALGLYERKLKNLK